MRKTPCWPLLALWGILLSGTAVRAQAPADMAESPAPLPRLLNTRPAAYVLPPLEEPPVAEVGPDPFLNVPGAAPPGFFTNMELLFLRPHLFSHLFGPVTVSPTQVDTVDLKTGGGMGSTLSPRLELGYRLRDQCGELTLAYRFENPERTSVPTDIVGGTAQKDRLNLNVIDMDWGNHYLFALPPGWDFRVNVGLRVASIYYDTQQNFGGPLAIPGGPIEQRATNNFVGAGPLVGVDLSREVFLLPGLALVGRLQFAGLFGEIRQTYSETTPTAGGNVFASNASSYQVESPILFLQGGLSYSPPAWRQSRFMLGYVWEEFWEIGRLNNTTGNLLNRGLFFRAEFNF